jgi:hypothetical protein
MEVVVELVDTQGCGPCARFRACGFNLRRSPHYLFEFIGDFMFVCECGREFKTKQGFTYHKSFCGKYEIFLDGGYEAKIGSDGKILYIHRDVMEKKLGRKLKPGELVHHIDENKRNNDPDNLELKNFGNHAKHHSYTLSDEKKKERNERIGIIGKIYGPLNAAKGSAHPLAKLDEEKVKEIKIRLLDGEKQSVLGREFKVDRSIIRDIKFNKIWKHVNIEECYV